ncbi:MAG: imidazole glycerol phosphate synthase subunit HisH [Clostridiales bacterium]|jgi:glutamine amidotransferase|nr:imidazole glycerol phosphate synthase subunit HisH [Clostridiales bacterium]
MLDTLTDKKNDGVITIIDYSAGNLTSVRRALVSLGIACRVTGDAGEIAAAERVIFPGVGNAKSAMESLNSNGVADALRTAIRRGVPVLGICLGMQIMMTSSDEGGANCLGIFDGGVKLLRPDDRRLKIPHMGWDSLKYVKEHALFDGIDSRSEFYFVHSYYVDPTDKSDVIALSEHGVDFPAVIGRGNVFAVQFHPEKSGAAGLKILQNFAAWNPKK